MPDAMSKLPILERAFALAQSSRCTSIDDIRRTLKGEQYGSIDEHLAGPSIRRQLNALCASAKRTDQPDDGATGDEAPAAQ
jgi:hypothetical protein